MMKLRINLFIPVFLLTIFLNCVHVQTELLDGALVFSEEFEGDSIRKYYWDYEDGCEEVRHLNMQHECFLNANNLQVANGTLILKAGKTYFDDNVMFTSARVKGNGFAFKYGTMAIRAKLPSGKYLHPTFYLLPHNQHFDRCKYEEIDIMEARGERTSSLIFSTKFGRKYNKLFTRSVDKSFKVDFSEDFHVFAIKWMPTRIEWYVDGVKVHEVNTHFISDWTQGKKEGLPCWKNGEPPFGEKSSLFLSLAVGGDDLYPEDKYGKLTEDDIKYWTKPTMEIDWVRVYNNEDGRSGLSSNILDGFTTTTTTSKPLPIDYTNSSLYINGTQNIVVRDYLAPFVA